MSKSFRRVLVPLLFALVLTAIPAAAAPSAERTSPWVSILELAERLWSRLGIGADGPSIVWAEEGASIDPDGRNGGTPPASAVLVEGQ
jgi:hypothetical protein